MQVEYQFYANLSHQRLVILKTLQMITSINSIGNIFDGMEDISEMKKFDWYGTSHWYHTILHHSDFPTKMMTRAHFSDCQ